MNSPKEARLLALERLQARIGQIIRGTEDDLRAASQGWWEAAGLVAAGGGAATCTATYSGTLKDCTGAGMVGQAITVKDVGGATLGTATSGVGGAFSGAVTITPLSQAVTLNTAAFTGYAASSLPKTFSCGSNAVGNFSPTPIINHAPTINTIGSQDVCSTGASFNVALSGITDGDGGTQSLTVTATSGNTGVIPNPTITYTSPNTTGTLTYTPVANSISAVTITVKVTDSGGTTCGGVNTKTTSFGVQVRDPSQAPKLDPIPNIGPIPAGSANQTVLLSGISAGLGEPAGILAISGSSSNPAASGFVSATYTSPSTSGSIKVSIGAAGVATITVTVTDSNPARCGTNNTFSRTFTVTVV